MFLSLYILGCLASIGILSSVSDTFKVREWTFSILLSALSWFAVLMIYVYSINIGKKHYDGGFKKYIKKDV